MLRPAALVLFLLLLLLLLCVASFYNDFVHSLPRGRGREPAERWQEAGRLSQRPLALDVFGPSAVCWRGGVESDSAASSTWRLDGPA